ncbi:MAG: filamentous hemagglutinin N-terminal domain-containing protein [Hydrococcus sp. SU_1_0]|nr:filamentous hemagglutinin N-terminal domain-containing protein [Hydrococcus sp. SU_1_0]
MENCDRTGEASPHRAAYPKGLHLLSHPDETNGYNRHNSHLLIISLLVCGSLFLFTKKSNAQSNIVPDNTLGDEKSIVTPDNSASQELITGGAQRGQNLFHSFQEFNISEGSGAYFVSPNANIANIFSRVTGNNVSEIFGTLGTLGASQPDLFLINPNGIIFGENASLDVGGSFLATTADSIQFGEQDFFSASNPETPPLLTIQPSALVVNQLNPGRIENNSVAPAGTDPTGSSSFFGLRVPDGESLSLLGVM